MKTEYQQIRRKIQILDTTLRDGGLGLEDAFNNKLYEKRIMPETRDEIMHNLSSANIDIIEIGSIEITRDNKQAFSIYRNIEEISMVAPKRNKELPMYVGLYRGPDTPIEDIPKYNSNYLEGIRVIIRYSELEKSLDFCSALSEKGYKVFVQPMLTMRYSNAELDFIINRANEMNAYALYFVDSYGYMTKEDVVDLFNKYNCRLDSKIKVGFHSHNNTNLAFANTIALLEYSEETKRDIIIDASCLGMGQGAGNLQTELILNYLMAYQKNKYKYKYVLEACQAVEKMYDRPSWGYSLINFIPARHQVAYKYAMALYYEHSYSYVEIDNMCEKMPAIYRHRYTKENLEKVIQLFKRVK